MALPERWPAALLGALVFALAPIAQAQSISYAMPADSGKPAVRARPPSRSPRVLDAYDALPGFHRVPVLASGSPRWAVASSAGYGLTEGQVGDSGDHHRAAGGVALAFAPWSWLELGTDARLRHDTHPADALGPDDGTVFDLRFKSRAGVRLAEAWNLGGAVTYWLPGADTVGDSFLHPGLDLQLVAAFAPDSAPYTLGATVGYRFDDSGGLAPTPPTSLRSGDRLTSGLSHSNAALLGLAGAYRFGNLEALAEVTWDVLVGDRAPPALESPLRVAGGARALVAESLTAGLVVEISPSERPPLGAGDPFVPVEPRFALLGSLAYRFADDSVRDPRRDARGRSAEQQRPRPRPPLSRRAERPAIATVDVEINVSTSQGDPLSDATVTLEVDGRSVPVPHRERQTYRVDGVRAGRVVVVVSAARLAEQRFERELAPGAPLSVDVRLEPAAAAGQIRGLVRSFRGEGVLANIVVQPLLPEARRTEITTTADGTFSVDVPPGEYHVQIRAPGYAPQVRRVVVGKDGVTILNADLVKAGR